MTWALLVILLLIILLISFAGQKHIAWSEKLQRIHKNTPREEWAAPEYVIQQVRNDYLMAVRWMRECALATWAEQWAAAPYYFAGLHLHRHQKILARHRAGELPRYRDVLKAEHFVEVRFFSSDGERCLVLDHQTERSIITYDYHTLQSGIHQALPDATVVYQLAYDTTACRWKIEEYIQELPFSLRASRPRIKVTAALPTTAGRDH
jgi:hypothetical protein